MHGSCHQAYFEALAPHIKPGTILIGLPGNPEFEVVYHLQKFSGKSGWKVNGTRLFRSSQRKIFESNGTSEMVVVFFPMEYSKRKFVFRSFKAIFDTSFKPSRPFFGKWN